ncbi:MAG: hypothetical protein N3B18_11545 [Desulfobacterota bacterium]|nr:hypothetical protein [Thermodesulfobacteriota bacterium]
MLDTRLKIIFATPFVAMAVSFFVAELIPFRSALTSEEQQIISFEPEDLGLPNIRRTQPVIDRSRPLNITSDQGNSEGTSAMAVQTVPPVGTVTMIVVGGQAKMAVIDGMLVREGERIGFWTVKKIEHNRVLIEPSNPQGEESLRRVQQWLYVEDIP